MDGWERERADFINYKKRVDKLITKSSSLDILIRSIKEDTSLILKKV